MDKIILEDRYTGFQKVSFLFFIGAPILLIIYGLLTLNLSFQGYIVLTIAIAIYVFIVCIAFLKRGFISIKSKLYRGSFFRGKLFFKSHIDISKTPKVAVLKFKKIQKFAFFSVARPDLGSGFNAFEINILNERHTKREEIIMLRDEKNVKPCLDFLTSNFNLEHEVFSPNFE